MLVASSFADCQMNDDVKAATRFPGLEPPVIADKKPTVIELEPGTYFWCSCGRSKKQPYCDGSHSGTGYAPIAFKIEERRKVALCNCKMTGKSPFCDGAHKKLPPTE